MVIGEVHQVLAAVQRPRLRAELPPERMRNLKEIHRIERRVKPFVALVVRHAVQQAVCGDAVVIAVNHLADEHKLRLFAVAVRAQAAHEIFIQHVRHVKTQAVDAEFVDPSADAV